MADLTFNQQLILEIVDKLSLVGIVGLVGFLANRALARYRTSQAIREKVAALRIEKIAPMWEEFDAIYQEIGQLYIATLVIVEESKGDTSHEDGGVPLSIDTPGMPQPGAEKRIQEKLGSEFEVLRNRIQEANKKVDAHRFWLGDKYIKKHHEHLRTLSDLLNSVAKGYLHPGAKEVDLSRLDIGILVKEL